MVEVQSVNVSGYQLLNKGAVPEGTSASSSQQSISPRDNGNTRVVESTEKVPGGVIRTTETSYRNDEHGAHGHARKTEITYGGTEGRDVAGYVPFASSSHVIQGPTTVKTYGAQQVSAYKGPAVTKTSTTTKDYISGATTCTQSGGYTEASGFVASAPVSHRVTTDLGGSTTPYSSSQIISSSRQVGGTQYATSAAHRGGSTFSGSPSQMQMATHTAQTTGIVFPTSSTTTTTNEKYYRTTSGHIREVSAGSQYNQSRMSTAVVSGGVVHSARTLTGQEHIISEKIVEVERMVPMVVTVEEIIEKVVIVPEKRVREEIREEMGIVRERIIEVARPEYVEKIVEVPEYETVYKNVEYAEVILQEKIREVPVIEYQERVIEVPKIVYQDKIIEIQEIETREVPVERVEEVVEVREQIVVKEIPVPQYVDKPFAEYVDVEEAVEVLRHFPIPIEAISTYEFKLPQIRAKWKKIEVPLYVPRFVELPVPIEFIDHEAFKMAESYAQKISMLGMMTATSLCELENLAKIKETNFDIAFRSQPHGALLENYGEFLSSGTIKVEGQFQSMKTQTQQQFEQTKITQSTTYGNEMSSRAVMSQGMSQGMTKYSGVTAYGMSQAMSKYSGGIAGHGTSQARSGIYSSNTSKFPPRIIREVGGIQQHSRMTSGQAQAASLMQKIVEEHHRKSRIRADSKRTDNTKHNTTGRSSKHRDHKERKSKKSSKSKQSRS